MKTGIFRIILFTLLLVCAASTLLAGGFRKAMNGPIPTEISIDPGQPTTNQQISVTVTLDAVVSGDQNVAIGCLNRTAFSSLPSVVTVPSGYDYVTFQATTSSTYSGAQIAATCNGGTALSPMPSPPPLP
jgi:hypothetical protein